MISDNWVKVRRGRGQRSFRQKPSLIENGAEIVLRGFEVFPCFVPVHGYKNKPNISNCIVGSLHYRVRASN